MNYRENRENSSSISTVINEHRGKFANFNELYNDHERLEQIWTEVLVRQRNDRALTSADVADGVCTKSHIKSILPLRPMYSCNIKS